MALACQLGIGEEAIRTGLKNFAGVRRRFTRTGSPDGITVIDDYGHHPVEIAAVLAAARQAGQGRVVAVVQPHRYTRLHDLFEQFCTCFNDADTVIVADVYAAGEQPIEGADRDHLVEGLRARGHRVSTPTQTGLGERRHLLSPDITLATRSNVQGVVYKIFARYTVREIGVMSAAPKQFVTVASPHAVEVSEQVSSGHFIRTLRAAPALGLGAQATQTTF